MEDFGLKEPGPENKLTKATCVSKAFKGDRRIEQRDNQILLRDTNGQTQVLLVPF